MKMKKSEKMFGNNPCQSSLNFYNWARQRDERPTGSESQDHRPQRPVGLFEVTGDMLE